MRCIWAQACAMTLAMLVERRQCLSNIGSMRADRTSQRTVSFVLGKSQENEYKAKTGRKLDILRHIVTRAESATTRPRSAIAAELGRHGLSAYTAETVGLPLFPTRGTVVG